MIQDVKDLKKALDDASFKLRRSLRRSVRTGEWTIKSTRADAYDTISKRLELILKKEQDKIVSNE